MIQLGTLLETIQNRAEGGSFDTDDRYVIRSGWDFITSPGSTASLGEVETIGYTFDEVPSMLNFVTPLGYKDGSDPTSVTDMTANFGNLFIIGAAPVSTSTFVVRINSFDEAEIPSGRRVLFCWMIIGKAKKQ